MQIVRGGLLHLRAVYALCMRTAFLFVSAVGVIAVVAAACGGSVGTDCPANDPGSGAACTTNGASCTYRKPDWCGASNTCTCNKGVWNCVPTGGGCYDAGKCIEGSTRPAGDGCNTCTCMNGTWGCTLIACVDGGAPKPDPLNVTCAGAPCAVPGNYCCDTPTLDGGVEKCVPDSTSSCAGLRRACDEAADCAGVTGTKVCCIPPNAAQLVAYNAQCTLSCKGDPFAYQLCKTTAECENGQACVTQTCNGYTISTCGPIPANRCN